MRHFHFLFLIVIVHSFFSIGCAPGDLETTSVNEYYSKHRSLIRDQYHQAMKAEDYRWILHLHFRGLDLSNTKPTETELAPLSNSTLNSKNHPFRTLKLAEDESALKLDFNYSNPNILGTLKYRNDNGDRAIKALSHLFQCENGKSQNLDKVLFILSGGSMGGGEAEYFAKAFRSICGKEVSMVITGDAIVRTGWFPMGKFKNIGSKTPCLNFFEYNPLLHGQPLSNCYNVEVHGAGHDTLQQSGLFFMDRLFQDLDEDPMAVD